MSDNILLVKLSSMGDVVHSFPALTEAASHGYRFDWVVEEAFVDLAAMHPAVDRIIPFGLRRWRRKPLSGIRQLGKFVRELRSKEYSRVLDAQGLLKSALVSRLSGAAQRTGLDADSAREPLSARLHTSLVAVDWDAHAIDRLRLLFSNALNYAVDLSAPAASPFPSVTPDFSANPEANQTVLIQGTTWRSKEYPEILWRGLIEALLSAGHSIVMLSGSASEYERAQRLCGHESFSAFSGTIEAVPPASLSLAAQRVLAARLVIGVDSGLTHLAAVLGRPTIGLYGSTSAARTGVRGPGAIDLASDFSCSPCLQRECTYTGSVERVDNEVLVPACFSRVSAERIMQAVKELDGGR